MRHVRGRVVGSGAGVRLGRAIRRGACFLRREGSSRAARSGYVLRAALDLAARAAWRCAAGGSRVAGAEPVSGWRGAEVADAHEAAWEQVEEEAAQELIDG